MARGGTSKRDARARELADRVASEIRAWEDANVSAGGACDFCGHLLADGYVTFDFGDLILAETSFIADDLGAATIPHAFDRLWLACSRCEPFVDAGDVDALVDHVLANRDVERVGEVRPELAAVIRADVVDLYTALLSRTPRKVR